MKILTPEYEAEVIIQALKQDFINNDPDERPLCGAFHRDQEQDIRAMKKLRKALKRVLSYYGSEP